LLYPAPERFPDKEGDTIGYKTAVVLPIAVRAKDAAKPVVLKVAVEYGVCKDVCIPAEASLMLTLPPGGVAKAAGTALMEAIGRVPRDGQARRTEDPLVKSIKIDLASTKPSILIEAEFPGDAKGADAFLDAPDGLWIPLAKAAGGSGAVRRFVVDLSDGADLGDLKGKTIRLTLVSASGQSETNFKLE
jgi:DsbC/DsbD-like thiol-disulfide interchange protein